ncbi:MAG: TRAP transporter small permease subunit [Mailhella sp.]|nr:TRAP transporter small permease subunit [Mailhella sp.]
MADINSYPSSLKGFATFVENCTQKFSWLSLVAMAILPVMICADVVLRLVGSGVHGCLEIQEVLLCLTTFSFMALLQFHDRHMQIDFLYVRFSPAVKRWCDMTVSASVIIMVGVLAWQSYLSFLKKFGTTSMELYVPLEFYYWIPVAGMALTFLVLALQLLRDFVRLLSSGHYFSVILGLATAAMFFWLPFWYRDCPYEVSNLVLGLIAFGLLFFFLFIRMPIAWTMSIIGTMGMIAIARNVPAALATVGTAPYSAAANFNLIALPLFVFMGCMILYSGISNDLFDSANKWIGHLPGGMGMAGVAGCTGLPLCAATPSPLPLPWVPCLCLK